MRGKNQARPRPNVLRQPQRRLAYMLRVRGDEQRVIEPALDEDDVDVTGIARPELDARGEHVLPVLLTTGVRMLSGGNEADDPSDAVGVHLVQRVGKKRVPVAHPDVHRKRQARRRKAVAKTVCLPPGQLGDWRDATEQLVMMGHFLDALGSYPSAAQHVGEKRPYVVRT